MEERHQTTDRPLDATTPLFKGFIRGMLPLYLLLLLQERAAHGTEMIRALSAMSGHRWRPSPGSVYPVLRRFEAEGLVTGRWRRSQAAPQRVYRLTKRGREALPEMRARLLDELRHARAMIDAHIEALETDRDLAGLDDG